MGDKTAQQTNYSASEKKCFKAEGHSVSGNRLFVVTEIHGDTVGTGEEKERD